MQLLIHLIGCRCLTGTGRSKRPSRSAALVHLQVLTDFSALDGGPQETLPRAVSADLGSLTLEFTRLSQLSHDPKYFDAVQRITDLFEDQQNRTALPGMWPVFINAQDKDFASGDEFSLGAMADSLYEYLPKQFLLLGGLHFQYRQMYETFIEAAKTKMFFRVMNPENKKLLFSGVARASGNEINLDSSGKWLLHHTIRVEKVNFNQNRTTSYLFRSGNGRHRC